MDCHAPRVLSAPEEPAQASILEETIATVTRPIPMAIKLWTWTTIAPTPTTRSKPILMGILWGTPAITIRM